MLAPLDKSQPRIRYRKLEAPRIPKYPYDSVLTLALPFVTFTPNCFARPTISIRFLAETEWEILASN